MESIVLYPTMDRQQLVPMVELAKLICKHHSTTLSVTILLPSQLNSATAQYIATVSSATPSLIFHHLPPPQPFLPILQPILTQLSSFPKAIILDFPNAEAASLNIPTYYYFPNAASYLALFLYLPTIHRNISNNKTNYFDAVRNVPGLPPLTPVDMPDRIRDRSDRSYNSYVKMSIELRKTNGFIVRTFEKLETRAVTALKNGACIPGDEAHTLSPHQFSVLAEAEAQAHTPPVFCVGPLISTATVRSGGNDEGNISGVGCGECMSWLNSQPRKSVVLFCFGSYFNMLSDRQRREIAVGLEKSGHRFLWNVKGKRLEEFLPEGFMERTKEKGMGMVVRNWAPLVDVLSHEAIGGFVTHCGWTSVVEAIYFGVPMVAWTWPQHAEHRLNGVVMVEEMKVALPLREEEEEGYERFVTAAELEKRVRELMDPESERGREVRERVLAARDDALAALSEGGSSRVALNELVELWKQS